MKEGKKRKKIKKTEEGRVCDEVGVRIDGNIGSTGVSTWVKVTELILGEICNLIMKAP